MMWVCGSLQEVEVVLMADVDTFEPRYNMRGWGCNTMWV